MYVEGSLRRKGLCRLIVIIVEGGETRHHSPSRGYWRASNDSQLMAYFYVRISSIDRPLQLCFEFIMSFLGCIQYIMQTVRALWEGERKDKGHDMSTQREKGESEL